ncbi:MAG: methyltransferase domain-containing protein [Synergistaceae bacterium]|nr:methyltransferase domain-containing protein [Synergistaceae bacterium]
MKHESITHDDILFGQVKLLQPSTGPRVNMDTVILADWVKVRSGTKKILEAGCASGAISLLLAQKYENVHVTGIEIQNDIAELAVINAENNGLSERVSFIAGDLRDKNLLPRESFDALVMNPPYEALSASRQSPDPSRSSARLEISCTPDDVGELAFRVLKSNGRFFAVFKSDRLDVFMSTLRNHRIIPKRLRPVYPKKDSNSNSAVFLIECVKNAGDGLSVLRPLFVRDDKGVYTQEIMKMYGK